jgi:hypothetical protein
MTTTTSSMAKTEGWSEPKELPPCYQNHAWLDLLAGRLAARSLIGGVQKKKKKERGDDRTMAASRNDPR